MTPERWRQIEDLYHAARERGAGVLSDVEPEVRQQVEQLLAQDSGGHILDQAAAELLDESTQTFLAPGTQLGPYQIENVLGVGGMGQVYRAMDSRLGRAVAIKISHERFSTRFEREGRAIAALNHPHICTLYDVGPNYLVMEMVEGETLAARLKKGRLSIEQTIQYGSQVADALAAAHAKGIIHRDLKPNNVMLAKSGVKVLDFGLAKSHKDETLTGSRMVMGTPAYMAPEQREGKESDARTDIYALGLMLYEMATAQRCPVDGELITLNSLPSQFVHVVKRCLASDPDNRWHTARDLKLELDWILPTGNILPTLAQNPINRRRTWTVLAALLLAAVALAAWRLWHTDYFWRNPLADAQVTRLTDFEGDEQAASISMDGKFVLFISDRAGSADAWVGQANMGTFVNLTQGRFPRIFDATAYSGGFSADGSQVWLRGGVANSASPEGVWIVPTLGGTPRRFLDAPAVNVAWSPDGSRIAYFTGAAGDPIFVADANVGNPRQVFRSATGDHNHYPTWSPGGRFIYFVRNLRDVWRVPVEGGKAEQITFHNSRVDYPALIDDRTLVYTLRDDPDSESFLYAVDVERHVSHRLNVSAEQYLSVAASGRGPKGEIRLVATVANPSSHLWTVPIGNGVATEEQATMLTLPTVRALKPRFGPKLIVYRSSAGGRDGIWRFKEGSALEVWRPSDAPLMGTPAITPDGQQISFVMRQHGRGALYVMTADGTNLTPLAAALDILEEPAWSSDGRWIVVTANDGAGNKLFKIPAQGGSPIALTPSMPPRMTPVWSPDGRFILYRVYQPAPEPEAIRAVTPDGNSYAVKGQFQRIGDAGFRFFGDSTRVVVAQGNGRDTNFWLLDLQTGQKRQLTNLKPLGAITRFDVSPDGKQIVFDRVRQNADIVLIELKR